MRPRLESVAACLALLLVGASVPASAQGVSARDRQAAADAYDRGTAAFLAEDFAEAARWFETAYRLAPASAALVEAARSWLRAGRPLRAANAGLRLRDLHGDEEAAAGMADRALATAGDDYLLIDVTCDGECVLELDGAVVPHPRFFVRPGEAHIVGASFESGTATDEVEGLAGQRRELAFSAPPSPDARADDDAEPVDLDGAPTPAATETRFGDLPAVLLVTAGGTAAFALAFSIAALVLRNDALAARDAYEATPTPDGLDAANAAIDELGTWNGTADVFWAIGAAVGVTGLILFLADGPVDDAPQDGDVEVGVGPGGLTIRGGW